MVTSFLLPKPLCTVSSLFCLLKSICHYYALLLSPTTFPFTSARWSRRESIQWSAWKFAHLTSTSTHSSLFQSLISRSCAGCPATEENQKKNWRTRRVVQERLREQKMVERELQWGWLMKGRWQEERQGKFCRGHFGENQLTWLKGKVAKFRLWKGNFFFFF